MRLRLSRYLSAGIGERKTASGDGHAAWASYALKDGCARLGILIQEGFTCVYSEWAEAPRSPPRVQPSAGAVDPGSFCSRAESVPGPQLDQRSFRTGQVDKAKARYDMIWNRSTHIHPGTGTTDRRGMHSRNAVALAFFPTAVRLCASADLLAGGSGRRRTIPEMQQGGNSGGGEASQVERKYRNVTVGMHRRADNNTWTAHASIACHTSESEYDKQS